MGDSNTNKSANNVDAVTALTNAATITALTNAATIRKLLRLPNEDGKTNFEIIQVRSISELANGHNCEVTIRVDLAFGHEGLPVPENERYSVRTETVRRIDLKDVAKLAGLELNDKQQYIGAATDVEAVSALLKAKLTEDDITISPIKDVMWVRTKPDSVGFIGMLTFAEGGEQPVEKLPTAINATLSASEVAIGEKVTATIEVLPADAANKAVTVVSSNPAIATVNANGTEVTGVAAPTVKVEKALNVKSLPVVKPATIEAIWGDLDALAIGDKFTPTVTVLPADAVDKTYTLYSENTVAIDVVNGEYVVGGYGSTALKVIANGDPAVVSATKITRVNETNAWTEYKLKLTHESSYGASDSDGASRLVNAGEMVNLIIRTTGLDVAQPITLEVSNPGVSIDFDASHTITTDGDIVVPLIINSAANTNPTQIKLMINGRWAAATAAFTVL